MLTNGWLLKPYHDWAMEILSKLPQDGTFNQERPLDRMIGCSSIATTSNRRQIVGLVPSFRVGWLAYSDLRLLRQSYREHWVIIPL